jgi:hypothetical protein
VTSRRIRGAVLNLGTGAQFLDYVWAQHERVLGHTHAVSNVLIEVNGERAASETYVVATL